MHWELHKRHQFKPACLFITLYKKCSQLLLWVNLTQACQEHARSNFTLLKKTQKNTILERKFPSSHYCNVKKVNSVMQKNKKNIQNAKHSDDLQ